MNIFVAGGSGVIGRYLVPELVRRGHRVAATSTTPAKAATLESWGAKAVVLDLLEADSVARVVDAVGPEVVVHQATALSGPLSLRRFDESLERTNLLRTEGLDNLLAAAVAAGSRRFVAQSFTGWPNAREGAGLKTESDPLDPRPPSSARRSLAAILTLESAVTGSEALDGVVTRYGALYGPGTSLGAGGTMLELVRRGRLPLVGGGGGIWSFVHVRDAALATAAAIERPTAGGLFNIVDDDPAPVSAWLPYLARTVGARTPWRMPVWLARLVVGEQGVAMMTEMRGSSNGKAKRELGWRPLYPSWREGFVRGLIDEPATPVEQAAA